MEYFNGKGEEGVKGRRDIQDNYTQVCTDCKGCKKREILNTKKPLPRPS